MTTIYRQIDALAEEGSIEEIQKIIDYCLSHLDEIAPFDVEYVDVPDEDDFGGLQKDK